MSTPDAAKVPPAPPAAAPPLAVTTAEPPHPAATTAHHRLGKKWWRWLVGGIVVLLLVFFGKPWLIRTLNTVSTDDAYVNGHVTFVAPRVAGQVARVLVDDNNRVRRGDLLVELDPEPYQVLVDIARAAVDVAQSDLVAATAEARGLEGRVRSLRFSLDRAIEDVNNQVALLRSKVANLQSQKASLDKARADFERAEKLIVTNAISKEDFDLRKESMLVAQAHVDEATEGVYQSRVALGLPAKPPSGNLTDIPDGLSQSFSAVRQAQGALIEAASQLGLVDSFNKTPREMIADFYKRDPEGQVDRIYAQLLKDAPGIKQAEAKLQRAKHDLVEAELNLRYCHVRAEIDGVVTRRNVNPGNNVVVGQSLMAVRSLREIWIDANFKETQLDHLRIGQAVDLDIDMYGSRQRFQGRISGFTMGTGSTLALLPPENATGNFVKVVQRLPVRIEVMNYDPEKEPLFIGLSVVPYVRIKEQPTGPDAGKFLQPYASTALPPTVPEKRP